MRLCTGLGAGGFPPGCCVLCTARSKEPHFPLNGPPHHAGCATFDCSGCGQACVCVYVWAPGCSKSLLALEELALKPKP